MNRAFQPKKFFTDVFAPQADDRVLILHDVPHGHLTDNPAWQERRAIAGEWHSAWLELATERPVDVLPLTSFPATGAHNCELPIETPVVDSTLGATLSSATIIMALTEFSASAPLARFAAARPGLVRIASMPMLQRRMEATALAADYTEVTRRCQVLLGCFDAVDEAEVLFSTGHRCRFDLRFRIPRCDNGQMHRGNVSPIGNLPAGETFSATYEGERPGTPSRTEGEIPLMRGDVPLVLRLRENRIVEVVGDSIQAIELRQFLAQDPARSNVAEFAFGCNPMAVVWGNVLEDEKAGFHWAFGRSEHLGGVTTPSSFLKPENVVHMDIVYAKDSPIAVRNATMVRRDGSRLVVIENGDYTVF